MERDALQSRHVCLMWNRERGCLAPANEADASADDMVTEQDVCIAVYVLARSLRSRCAMDRQSRDGCSCPPLDALEQMMQWLGDRPARRGAAEDETSCARLSLGDLVHQALPIQAAGPDEELCARLIRALASVRQESPMSGMDQSHLWHG